MAAVGEGPYPQAVAAVGEEGQACQGVEVVGRLEQPLVVEGQACQRVAAAEVVGRLEQPLVVVGPYSQAVVGEGQLKQLLVGVVEQPLVA